MRVTGEKDFMGTDKEDRKRVNNKSKVEFPGQSPLGDWGTQINGVKIPNTVRKKYSIGSGVK